MNQLNLKTGEVSFIRKGKFGFLGLVIGIFIIVIVGLAIGYLNLVMNKLAKEKDSLKNEIALQEKFLKKDDFWPTYDFESRLQVVGDLLKKKNQPTKSLVVLSEKTLPETVFKELKVSFDDGVKTVFECKVVVPSYSFLARQVEAYKTIEGVVGVGFDSGAVTEEGIESVVRIFLEKDKLGDKNDGN